MAIRYNGGPFVVQVTNQRGLPSPVPSSGRCYPNVLLSRIGPNSASFRFHRVS